MDPILASDSTEQVFDDLLKNQEAAKGQDQPEPEPPEAGTEEAKEEPTQEATNDEDDKDEADTEAESESETDDDGDGDEESSDESEDTTDEDAESESEEIERFRSIEEIAEAADTPVELLMAEVELYKDADGKPVTLEEAKKATLRESDYHRKLNELDAKSKDIEQQASDRMMAQQQKAQQTDHLLNLMAEEYTRDLNAIDFDRLEQEDPADYAAKVAKFDLRRKTLEGLAENAAHMRQQMELDNQARFNEQMQSHRIAQEQRLFELKPEYRADPEMRKAFEGEAKEYLKSLGTFEENELDIQDARFYQILEDAMKGRGLQAAKKAAVKQKLTKAPKLQRPGKSAGKGQIKSSKRKASLKRVRKEGTQEALAGHFDVLLGDDPAFSD